MIVDWVESVINVSEGRQPEVIEEIASAFQSQEDVQVLHCDTGFSANRTVYTLAGPLPKLIESVFQGTQKAIEKIDLRSYSGNHPYVGVVDVIPFIPLNPNLKTEFLQSHIDILAERFRTELDLPVFYYEKSCNKNYRKSLAQIRKGGIAGLSNRMQSRLWESDNSMSVLHATAGATVMGIRDYMLAYNVSLSTQDLTISKNIAKQIRTSGGLVRMVDGTTKKVEVGQFKKVKAIGWYVEEYGHTQVSINVYDLAIVPLKELFDTINDLAKGYGVSVIGSELIGLIPAFYLAEAAASLGFVLSQESVSQLIDYFGFANITTFDPQQRILEWVIQNKLAR